MSDDAGTPPPRSAAARVVRILVIALVVAVVIVVLFTTVFPWVEQRTQVPTIGTTGWTPTAWLTSS